MFKHDFYSNNCTFTGFTRGPTNFCSSSIPYHLNTILTLLSSLVEWTSCAVVYMVSYGLTRSLMVLYHLSRSCTIANTIIHGHGTCVSFLKSFKNHTPLEWPECNSEKARVGSVVCTVYTDGQPCKPCVLCQTGFM